jgi:hypothetical protein
MSFWRKLEHARTIHSEEKNQGTLLVDSEGCLKGTRYEENVVQAGDAGGGSEARRGDAK